MLKSEDRIGFASRGGSGIRFCDLIPDGDLMELVESTFVVGGDEWEYYEGPSQLKALEYSSTMQDWRTQHGSSGFDGLEHCAV